MTEDTSTRKRFLGAGAASGLAAFLAACGDKPQTDSSTTDTGASPAGTPEASMTGDLAILNYALTLEYLEADFYAQVDNSGLASGKVSSLVKALGQTEQDHVDSLTQTITSLGGTPVTKPKTKFGPVLEQGLDAVLKTAATVENLGAAAYLGQAPKIESKEILAAALSIHSVEARHAAALNMVVGRGFTGKSPLQGSIPDGAFAAPMQMQDVLTAVKPYLA